MIKKVVIGLLGVNIDNRGQTEKRWEQWRPSVSIFQQEDLLIDRFDLLHQKRDASLSQQVLDDVRFVSPTTQVNKHQVHMRDPWDFQDVYGVLLDFVESYDFDTEKEEYFLHITTGTHVAQICWFLLTEANYIPAKLIQTSPATRRDKSQVGRYQIIDLDISKYDQIASRFQQRSHVAASFLKGGIETNNKAFNSMIEQLEKISIRSSDPILLTGPTGAGKTQLASRIYELKKQEDQLSGNFVVVNCATLRGDNAMSALFGHKRGSFTGAVNDRAGLLQEAHRGLLFLDEIGELALDEQAMLLRAIETGKFLPVGADTESTSDFQVIAGTNRDLIESVLQGRFREDLLARVNLWTYQIPSLSERPEDIEPNILFELDSYTMKYGTKVAFTKTAYKKYLKFALSSTALWTANFRDLNASIRRMATLTENGRINEDLVSDEIQRLKLQWGILEEKDEELTLLNKLLGDELTAGLDYFEKLQLSNVIRIIAKHSSLASAGRELFAVSRLQKKQINDSHRIRQYLSKYNISFEQIKAANC